MLVVQRRSPIRRWSAALVGACMIGLGIFAIVGGSRTSTNPVDVLEPVPLVDTVDAVDDVEVCETTVYQGCPQRWDYLLTDDS